MIGLGQAAFASGGLVWPELNRPGLTDWLTGTDDSTERSSGSNSIEIGRQCSQQFHRARLDLNDRVMHLNPANTTAVATACYSYWLTGRWCEFCGDAVSSAQLPPIAATFVPPHSSWQNIHIPKGTKFEPWLLHTVHVVFLSHYTRMLTQLTF